MNTKKHYYLINAETGETIRELAYKEYLGIKKLIRNADAVAKDWGIKIDDAIQAFHNEQTIIDKAVQEDQRSLDKSINDFYDVDKTVDDFFVADESAQSKKVLN